MALNINPLDGMYNAISIVRTGIGGIGTGLAGIINNKYVSGGLFDMIFDIKQAQGNVFSAMSTVMSKIVELDTTLNGWLAALNGIPQKIEDRAAAYVLDANTRLANIRAGVGDEIAAVNARCAAYVADANQRLANIRAKTGAEWTSMTQAFPTFAYLEQRAGEYADDRRNQATAWVTANVLPIANAAKTTADTVSGKLTTLTSDFTTFKASVPGVADAAAVLRANAAVAAANANASKLDAELARLIDSLTLRVGTGESGLTGVKRTLDEFRTAIAVKVDGLTGKVDLMPETTAALNRRIDQVEKVATEQANAALAAANENILTKLSPMEELTTSLKTRMDRMELQIDKVAPILAKIPKFPIGGG